MRQQKPKKLKLDAGSQFTVFYSHESPPGCADASEEVMGRALAKAKAIRAAKEAGDMAEFYKLIDAEPLDAATVDILIQMTDLIATGLQRAETSQLFERAGAAGGRPVYPHREQAEIWFLEARENEASDHQAYLRVVEKFAADRTRKWNPPSEPALRRWLGLTKK